MLTPPSPHSKLHICKPSKQSKLNFESFKVQIKAFESFKVQIKALCDIEFEIARTGYKESLHKMKWTDIKW